MEKAHAICIEMFSQRDYNIIEYDDHQIIACKPDGNLVCTFLVDIDKFNTDRIHEYISILNKIEIKHGVIIYKDIITSVAKKLIETMTELKIELFNKNELQFNITKHRLQPKFELLEESLYKKYKKQYGSSFLVMLKTDPISKFYGYEKDAIIKITRNDNGIETISYRIVK
jgi:DNA-directed RNA polymerase subunit H (RpoH/RPB5)